MGDVWERILKPIAHEIDELSPSELASKVLQLSMGHPGEMIPVLPETNPIRSTISLSLAKVEWQKFINENLKNIPQQHLALIFSLEIDDLFDALATGKNHPALDYWLEQREKNASRPITSERGILLRGVAVVGATNFTACGMSLTKSYEEVAKIANKSGVFNYQLASGDEVTASKIERWRREVKDRGGDPDDGNADLSKALRLPKLGSDYKNSRTFQFWSHHTMLSFLGIGTALVDQMMQMGIDPVDGLPEEVRKKFYGN